MRAGLWLPLFEELADPRVVARLAADAQECGWHEVFGWDQLRWREPIKAQFPSGERAHAPRSENLSGGR